MREVSPDDQEVVDLSKGLPSALLESEPFELELPHLPCPLRLDPASPFGLPHTKLPSALRESERLGQEMPHPPCPLPLDPASPFGLPHIKLPSVLGLVPQFGSFSLWGLATVPQS